MTIGKVARHDKVKIARRDRNDKRNNIINSKDMGFNFNFFGTQEVRKFSYKPRFYDPEKEERKKMFGDHSKEKAPYVPGSHVKGSLRDGNYQRTKDISSNQKILGMITTLLLFAVIYLVYKYFPILVESLMK